MFQFLTLNYYTSREEKNDDYYDNGYITCPSENRKKRILSTKENYTYQNGCTEMYYEFIF